jgi:hypothetical protein
MSSIRAIGSPAEITAYQPGRVSARAVESTPTPSINPVDRVDKLTRQLDAKLTDKLARIRSQISTSDSVQAPSPQGARRLDLSV